MKFEELWTYGYLMVLGGIYLSRRITTSKTTATLTIFPLIENLLHSECDLIFKTFFDRNTNVRSRETTR